MRKKHLVADQKLGEIEDQVPFSLVNPANADAIRRKFLKKPFEPEFHYHDMPDTALLREKLAGVKCGKRGFGDFLTREKALLFEKIHMVERIGRDDFGKASKVVYGAPSKGLVKHAKKLLDIQETPSKKKIRHDEVKKLLVETFKRLGFRYRIQRKQMVASAQLAAAKRTLYLRSKERFSRDYVYRLAIHEIATHALRAENGTYQSLKLLSRGTPGYLATEEGLAAYNEERAGVMQPSTLKRYAGRVIAVHLAQEHTFVETYKLLREWYDEKSAFKLTLRAKRGVPRGETLGACTKDHVYLKGYYQVKEFVAYGGNISMLHAAKISVAEVELLGRKLQPPKHIPEPVIEWMRYKMLTEA